MFSKDDLGRLAPWRLALLASALLPALLSPAALAHLGAPEGRFPFITSEGLIGGGTTWGIVRKDGERWLRVCEEAFEELPPFYYRKSDGTLILARSDGLWLTDTGCHMDPGPSLFEGRRPSLLAVPRDRPATLFVATAMPNGGNGLYVSDDEGESFRPTGLADEDVSFRSLAVSEDGSLVYLAAIHLDSREPVVFVSEDGGVSFMPKAPWPEGVLTANVVGRDPGTGEVALVLLDLETPGSRLVLADAGLEELTEIGTFDGVVSDFLVHQDAWLVIESRQRYFRRAKNEDEFVRIDEGPTRCLLKLPGDERVWGCGQPFQNGHFLVSEDGISFDIDMPFLVVEEWRCPAGTIGAQRCAYLWPDEEEVVPKRDAGPGGGKHVERPREEPEGGCPCSLAGGSDPSLLGLLGLTWLLGRRRSALRRARPRSL